MPVKNLKVTLIQANLHWEDVDANLIMFGEKIAGLKEATDLIVLPEMFSTGFSMNVAKLAEPMNNSKAIKWMRKMAAGKNAVITGSLMLEDGGAFYNRLIWMLPNGTFEQYDKRHLFSLSNEEKLYTPGNERIMVELKGWRVCPLVCYDLRFPVWSRNEPHGYDLLLYVANWPERRIYAWKQLLVARAIENQSYVIGLNRVGNDGNDIYHSGDSMVVDALGNVLYHKQHDEDVFTTELNYEELEKTRKALPFLKDADSFIVNPKAKIQSH
ncbi:MAG TPA: amidohydrolase [Chitinophagales bacterium]|nr:amidohydrolase [Chitinophagales bacterium]